MIPASFSAIRGITARGSWPGSDSRHDDRCPLVTLRGYLAGGSRNQRKPRRPKDPGTFDGSRGGLILPRRVKAAPDLTY
jgi:hypothetical protein